MENTKITGSIRPSEGVRTCREENDQTIESREHGGKGSTMQNMYILSSNIRTETKQRQVKKMRTSNKQHIESLTLLRTS